MSLSQVRKGKFRFCRLGLPTTHKRITPFTASPQQPLPPPSSSVCLTTTTTLTRDAVHRHCSGNVCICPSIDRQTRHRRERLPLRPGKGRGRLVESQEEGRWRRRRTPRSCAPELSRTSTSQAP